MNKRTDWTESNLDSLGVLDAKLQAMRLLIDERDKLYRERDEHRRTAVDAALIAVKDQTKSAFESSEKAISKAEEAQKAYNQTHNDLSRKLDDQNKATMPRMEIEQRFRGIEEKVNDLRELFSLGGGRVQGSKLTKDENRANLAIFISIIMGVLALFAFFMK